MQLLKLLNSTVLASRSLESLSTLIAAFAFTNAAVSRGGFCALGMGADSNTLFGKKKKVSRESASGCTS
jgi:hypothetical protein